MIAARCAAKRAPAKARLPSARAACLARAPLRLTDTSGPAQTSETSQTARGLSAPVGGRALGLRSEGSWLAAELLRAGLEPGAVDRRAGWTGFCPSNDQPSPRCAPPSPRPRAPHAPRRARARTRPARPRAPWEATTTNCMRSYKPRHDTLWGYPRETQRLRPGLRDARSRILKRCTGLALRLSGNAHTHHSSFVIRRRYGSPSIRGRKCSSMRHDVRASSSRWSSRV